MYIYASDSTIAHVLQIMLQKFILSCTTTCNLNMKTSYHKTRSLFLSFLLLQVILINNIFMMPCMQIVFAHDTLQICHLVNADYRLEVTVHTYSNTMQVRNNGGCCDSLFASPPNCPDNECDTWFTFCLRVFNAIRDSDPSNCLDSATPSSYETSDAIHGNIINFQGFVQSPDVPNPLVFTGPSWPVSN